MRGKGAGRRKNSRRWFKFQSLASRGAGKEGRGKKERAVGGRRRRKLDAVSKRRQFLHLGEIKTSDATKRRVFFNFATLMRPWAEAGSFYPPPSPPLASPFFEEAFYFELFVPSCSRIHLHKIQAAVSVLRERGGINFAPSGGNFACLLRWKHTSDGEIFKLLLARPKNRRWVVAGVGWRRGADPLPPCSTSRIHPFYPPISGINSCSIINESNRPTGNARVWHVFRCSPDFEKIMGETLVNSKFNSFFFFLRIL